MTVFLTTQYLEEADQLADHLGIIDHGKIVAAGTPDALKAEVGRPTVEVVPTDHAERDRAVELLRPFGELVPGTPQGAAVRLEADGGEELANIIRAFDQAGVKVANLELHEASLNDVFLAKTGRSLEGAQARGRAGGRDRRAARPRGSTRLMEAAASTHRRDRGPGSGPRSGRRRRSSPAARSCGRSASPRRSSRPRIFPLILLAINSVGLKSATSLPGFPTDSYVTFALAFAFIQAGVFAVIGTGQNLAEDNQGGFFNRLQLTPIHPAALVAGQLAGTLVLGLFQAATYIAVGPARRRAHRRRASPGRS